MTVAATIIPQQAPREQGAPVTCTNVAQQSGLNFRDDLGTVIAEAWSMWRPLVAALADGARQYVRDDDNGAVFPIDDDAALARRILQIADDPQFAARIVENGYSDYERLFAREIVIDHLLDIYRTVIAARRAA